MVTFQRGGYGETPLSIDGHRLKSRVLRNRPLAAALAVAYLAFVTLAHDLMQQPAYWAQDKLSHRSWNSLVAGCSVLLLVVVGAVMVRRIARHAAPFVASVYLLVPVLLAVIAFRTMMIMNIEMIHFPQYAILGVLLYPLTKRYVDLVLLVTFAGMIDEGYQFFVLHGHWGIYYDFNDVLLNTIGAGFAVAFLFILDADRTLSPRPRHDGRLLFRYAIPICAVALLLVYLVLTGAGVIAVNPLPDADPWTVVLRRSGPSPSYWTTTDWGKTYHELLPWEWIVLTAPLLLFYAALDRRCAQSGTAAPSGL